MIGRTSAFEMSERWDQNGALVLCILEHGIAARKTTNGINDTLFPFYYGLYTSCY